MPLCISCLSSKNISLNNACVWVCLQNWNPILSYRFRLPYTPLRELKPDLFKNEYDSELERFILNTEDEESDEIHASSDADSKSNRVVLEVKSVCFVKVHQSSLWICKLSDLETEAKFSF